MAVDDSAGDRPVADAGSEELDPALRDDVRLLGELLGRAIASERGPEFIGRIEKIRQLAKEVRAGSTRWDTLRDYLAALPDDALVDVARAFNQFLNLANIAEQHHQIRIRQRAGEQDMLAGVFERLQQQGHQPEQLAAAVAASRVELVLTAHPTEVIRRTLIRKYDAIAHGLGRLEQACGVEAQATRMALARLVAEAWYSDELREEQPTPQDEAKWGFAVVENSLWQALPRFMRRLDRELEALGAKSLPLDAAPIRFVIWMGGDRDGNPNVTAPVTREDHRRLDLLRIGRLTGICFDSKGVEPGGIPLEALSSRWQQQPDGCHDRGQGESSGGAAGRWPARISAAKEARAFTSEARSSSASKSRRCAPSTTSSESVKPSSPTVRRNSARASATAPVSVIAWRRCFVGMRLSVTPCHT
jgi:hypothetical protein